MTGQPMIGLGQQFGLQPPELVAIVGAGGKSTILFALAADRNDWRVVVTTTTRMGADQLTEPTCWSDDPAVVDATLEIGIPLFVATGRVHDKITGPSPEAVDRLFTETRADLVVVEADGARGMSFKAPADHEPVIPTRSTTVVVVASIDAIGRPITEVAHNHMLVGQLIGTHPDHRLTVDGAAAVLLHADGGLKGIPDGARVVMATTMVTPATKATASQLAAILGSHARVDRAVTLARSPATGEGANSRGR